MSGASLALSLSLENACVTQQMMSATVPNYTLSVEKFRLAYLSLKLESDVKIVDTTLRNRNIGHPFDEVRVSLVASKVHFCQPTGHSRSLCPTGGVHLPKTKDVRNSNLT